MRVTVGDYKATDLERQYINQILDTGRISYGPFCKQFEQEFANRHGCKYGILSNSGTSSLHVALQTLKEVHGWQDGDEILVPALTFVATANVVLHNNLTPVLVDVDPIHYAIDPKLISDKVTKCTRAIIPVHPFGQPADMRPIMNYAYKYNLKIIEDSCESMGVGCENPLEYKYSVGNMSHIACFSTYVAHIIQTGVGGIAITNEPIYAEKMRSLVNHGRDSIYISQEDNVKSDEVIKRRFNFTSVGHSFRATEFEAALGLAQLQTLEETIKQRNSNASYLTQGLQDLVDHLQLPGIRVDNEHAFMMYPIVLLKGDKWDLIKYLEQYNIETREMLPLTNQPVYSNWVDENNYPVAQWINKKGFYIGCHNHLSQDDLNYVIEVFRRYFGSSKKSAYLVEVTKKGRVLHSGLMRLSEEFRQEVEDET